MNRRILLAALAIMLLALAVFLARPRPGGDEPENAPVAAVAPRTPKVAPASDPYAGFSPEMKQSLHRRDQRNEYLIRTGMISTGEKKATNLIAANGLVSRAVLKDAGIPEEKLPAIQEAVDQMIQDAEAVVARNIIPDPHQTDAAKGVQAYRIRGDSEEADRIQASFEQALRSIAGESSAKQVLASFHPQMVRAGMGRLNVSIVFTPAPADGSKSATVSFKTSEPIYDYPGMSAMMVRGELGKDFGRAFDFVK